MTPRRALATAARAVTSHLAAFINFEERAESERPSEPGPPEVNPHLFTPITELDLSVRAHNRLQKRAARWPSRARERAGTVRPEGTPGKTEYNVSRTTSRQKRPTVAPGGRTR